MKPQDRNLAEAEEMVKNKLACGVVNKAPRTFRQKNRCCSPPCNRIAWLEDWAGWTWCFRHWYRSMRWGGGRKWLEIKRVKVNIIL